jgi:hypothetical protein
MKRDMELIRTILLEVEAHQNPNTQVNLKAPGYSPENVSHHVKILAQHGYVEAFDAGGLEGICWIPRSLTWEGHEFLDATRNETVWQKLKAHLKDKGMDAGMALPLDVIKQLAIQFISDHVGLR